MSLTLTPQEGQERLEKWLHTHCAISPKKPELYVQALTHASFSSSNYERLEFLGDRVLGMVIAELLYTRYPQENEGALSNRYNALVQRVTCAEVARDIGLAEHLILGKQARDDGAYLSDNVLGDVVEALIGALVLDHGLPAARSFILKHWQARLAKQRAAPQHPKSALQEWAASHKRKPPLYSIIEKAGSVHLPAFTVRVEIERTGEALGKGSSKQEAETKAAEMLLTKLVKSK